MSYRWMSTLHRTAAERDETIAYDWFTANGDNSPATVDQLIADGLTAESAADEAIAGWGLLEVYDEDGCDYRGSKEGQPVYPDLTRESMIAAMQAFINTRPDRDGRDNDDEEA